MVELGWRGRRGAKQSRQDHHRLQLRLNAHCIIYRVQSSVGISCMSVTARSQDRLRSFSRQSQLQAMGGFLERLSGLYSSVLQPWTRTRSFSLTLVAVLSSSVTLLSLLGWQSLARREHRRQLRDSVESHFSKQQRGGSLSRSSTLLGDEQDEEMQDYTKSPKDSMTTSKNSLKNREIDQEIIDEALARNTAFLGEEAMKKIRASFVVVVGMGGVGSAAGEPVYHFILDMPS